MATDPGKIEACRYLLDAMRPYLDGQQWDRMLGAAALVLEEDGISLVQDQTGEDRGRLARSAREAGAMLPEGSPRSPVPVPSGELSLEDMVRSILEGALHGTTAQGLRWTSLTPRRICAQLQARYGKEADQLAVKEAMSGLGYDALLNQKDITEVGPCPDPDAQAAFLLRKIADLQRAGAPTIFADIWKMDPAAGQKDGNGQPKAPGLGIPGLEDAAPSGLYVMDKDTAIAGLGRDHEPETTAAECVFRWWECVGRVVFPDVKTIYVMVRCTGHPFYPEQWRYAMQRFADLTGLEVHISHFPAVTLDWEDIAMDLLCYSHSQSSARFEGVVSLIGPLPEGRHLAVGKGREDQRLYWTHQGTQEQMDDVLLEPLAPYGNWNYIIHPKRR